MKTCGAVVGGGLTGECFDDVVSAPVGLDVVNIIPFRTQHPLPVLHHPILYRAILHLGLQLEQEIFSNGLNS
ncbi:hypothetical protein TWF788_004328 [Orbilia oligospora]|uniref:Uncharacterized protein n=1 Tax=Orbilia oligospora TaxID=2813651 RepID=A0A6G1MH86_ORBOL|nr:hypothetical protein TWF788_004328 [Orbilia oligospora]KAF3203877.1 hypothetical protein TWF679_010056 [Orbilia oligospora]KAF3227549.1 hypothetical protein TWF191_003633 [Orbilia oligospora]KAF3258903.1 hypothetical protein TWF192_011039 [Orbilia oligospora]